jgi:tryptophan-rich sensory protein
MSSQCGNLASLVNSSYGTPAQTVAVVETVETCGGPAQGCGFTTNLYHQFSQKGLWLFILAAVVVIIILAWVCRGGRQFWCSLEKWSWGNNDWLWIILMVIGLILFAWAAFTAFVCLVDNLMKRNFVAACFGIVCILVIAWGFMFFRRDSNNCFCTTGIKTAGYIIIVAAVVALLCLYPMWGCGNAVLCAMIPFLVWVIVIAVLNNNISGNLECCD